MIFSHWHFCHTLKMSPEDTRDFLDFLFTLEEKNSSLSEKNAALEWLEKQDETLLHVYAVPLLVKGALTGNNEDQTIKSAGEEYEHQVYLQKNKKLIIGLLEAEKQTSQTKACLSLLYDMDKLGSKELVDRVLAIPYVEPEREYLFSYLESEECKYSIIILSFLCAIAEKEPEMVSEVITAEKKLPFIDKALEQKSGRLPWKLAMTLRCFCGMTFEVAEKFYEEYWIGSAECLEITAHILLEEQKASENSREAVVGRLIEESYTLDFFSKYKKKIPLEGLWIDEKADYLNLCKICAILWQNILWNTAFEYDEGICANQLRTLWNAPVYYRTTKKAVKKRLRNLLIPYGAGISNIDQCPEYYFCTPWQKRTKKKNAERVMESHFRNL